MMSITHPNSGIIKKSVISNSFFAYHVYIGLVLTINPQRQLNDGHKSVSAPLFYVLRLLTKSLILKSTQSCLIWISSIPLKTTTCLIDPIISEISYYCYCIFQNKNTSLPHYLPGPVLTQIWCSSFPCLIMYFFVGYIAKQSFKLFS